MSVLHEPPLLGISIREPPASIECEHAVLGCLLWNNRALDQVVEFLRPEHFVHPVHGQIYEVIAKRVLAGEKADLFTLKTQFDRNGFLESVGGASYLAALFNAPPDPHAARQYGHVVLDHWRRRKIIGAGEEMVNAAFAAQESPDDTVNRALNAIESVMGATSDRPAVSLDEAMDDVLRAAEEAMYRGGPDGVSTGMRSIDTALGGLEPGTLTLLAGRPGMGKTALAIGWALACARAGNPVTMFSLEMSARSLGRRLLAGAANVSVLAVRRGELTADQAGALVAARKELAGLGLTIEDAGGLTPATIALKARSAKRRRGLALLIVDHLHIVKPESADVKAGATWAVGQVCLALQRIAKALDVPVLALAQLNRGVEGREDKRPAMSDLRQAGDLEQNADAVCFVYRPEYYLSKSEPERKDMESAAKHAERVDEWRQRKRELAGKAELIFEKVRDGAPCVVPLHWHAETTSFSEAE